jgi:hypothetical protein
MKCQVSYEFDLDEPGERERMDSLVSCEFHERKLNALHDLFRSIIKYDAFPENFAKCTDEEKQVITHFIHFLRSYLQDDD